MFLKFGNFKKWTWTALLKKCYDMIKVKILFFAEFLAVNLLMLLVCMKQMNYLYQNKYELYIQNKTSPE